MAVLPASTINLFNGIERQQSPSLTWGIDHETQRIVGTVDLLSSVQQAVEVYLNVQRFSWQIYRPYTGSEFDDLLGLPSSYVGAELQRRIRDALLVDDRITGVSDFTYSVENDMLTASFTVHCVYGAFQSSVEVSNN